MVEFAHDEYLAATRKQLVDGRFYVTCNITQNEKMKKRSLDCSNERFVKEKGGYLLSRIALQYHRRKRA